MMAETRKRKSIAGDENIPPTSSCAISSSDAFNGILVVKLLKGASGEAKDEGEGSSVDLLLHRSLLIENSAFFSAQLSERWAEACTRDASGRPIVVIKDCEEPEDFATALQKLHEKGPGDPAKCPVHTFSSFEDALRCLIPADQLCLSSVLSSAVEYLESIPWTSEQAEKLSEVLAKVSAANSFQKLVDRTEPPPEEVRTLLLDELFARANFSEEEAVRKGARSIAHEIMQEHNLKSQPRSKATADSFSAGLLRSLLQLEKQLEDLEFRPGRVWDPQIKLPIYKQNPELFTLVGSLAWMFQFSHLLGKMDIRRNVVEVMTLLQARCEAELYKTHIFYTYIAEPLYTPVINAVAEGSLVISSELRTKLLRMWVPRKYENHSSDWNSQSMQAAFSAVLSTVGFRIQEQILHDWLGDLMGADPLEPWFKEWVTKLLVEGSKVHTSSQK